MKSRRNPKALYLLLSIITVIAVLGIWQYCTGILELVPSTLLPSPSKVVQSLLTKLSNKNPDGATLVEHTLVSLNVALQGYGLALLIGIPLGIMMAWSDPVDSRRGLDPTHPGDFRHRHECQGGSGVYGCPCPRYPQLLYRHPANKGSAHLGCPHLWRYAQPDVVQNSHSHVSPVHHNGSPDCSGVSLDVNCGSGTDGLNKRVGIYDTARTRYPASRPGNRGYGRHRTLRRTADIRSVDN